MNRYLIEKLKEGRTNAKLKQSEVAEKIGIKGNTVSNYENGVSEPDIDTFCTLCDIYNIDPSELLNEAYGLGIQGEDFKIKPSEIEQVKKYRFISERSPDGAKVVDSVLDGMYSVVEQMKSPESGSTIIEFHGKTDDTGRFLEYFRSASAGTGVFILGNEASEKIAIPDTPENQLADYAIGVDGNSMEPDYHDGDIVLVSQKLELNHGDVGIFVINNKAYIKEYGETELISRNPDADNIRISEYDNIVCMGKVIGILDKTFGYNV